MNINAFPNEILLHIFDYLTPQEIAQKQYVCKKWSSLIIDLVKKKIPSYSCLQSISNAFYYLESIRRKDLKTSALLDYKKTEMGRIKCHSRKVSCFYVKNNDIYIGTSSGRVMQYFHDKSKDKPSLLLPKTGSAIKAIKLHQKQLWIIGTDHFWILPADQESKKNQYRKVELPKEFEGRLFKVQQNHLWSFSLEKQLIQICKIEIFINKKKCDLENLLNAPIKNCSSKLKLTVIDCSGELKQNRVLDVVLKDFSLWILTTQNVLTQYSIPKYDTLYTCNFNPYLQSSIQANLLGYEGSQITHFIIKHSIVILRTELKFNKKDLKPILEVIKGENEFVTNPTWLHAWDLKKQQLKIIYRDSSRLPFSCAYFNLNQLKLYYLSESERSIKTIKWSKNVRQTLTYTFFKKKK